MIFLGQLTKFLIQFRVLVTSEEAALPCRHLEGRPCLKGNVVETAVVKQTSVVVDRTRCFHIDFHPICNQVGNRNAELYLIGNQWLADILLQECDLHWFMVGNTKMADFSAVKQDIKCGSHLFRFNECIRTVEQQKIEGIRPETL